MKYLVNSNEMRLYDKNTSEIFKVPPFILMEQAALAACEEIEKTADKKGTILIVCGSGNNGGDGLAIARILFLKGYSVEVVFIGDEKKATEQNQKQQEILSAYEIPILKEILPNTTPQVVIDAVFGVGLTRNIEGNYKLFIEKMNSLSGYKIALDVPSGVSADTGAILGTAFRADMTITFAFDKVGLHLWPGNEHTGRIVVKEIGITEHSFLGQIPEIAALEASDLDCLKERPSHSNKGTFGKLLVIAGSKNMAGAAILAGKSAYTAGCGLVRILTPEENRIIIQTALPEAVLTVFDAENTEQNIVKLKNIVKEALDWADAVVIGPGLGTKQMAKSMVEQVLQTTSKPVVLDADALNLIAKDKTQLEGSSAQIIITPHLGEMSRLTGKNVKEIQNSLLETVRAFTEEYHVISVLKDERTITSIPNKRIFLNLSGNSGMATAGSGDVLSGIIGSLLAQGYLPEKAAPLGVYFHGLAGDAMIKETGKAGFTAGDFIKGMQLVLKE